MTSLSLCAVLVFALPYIRAAGISHVIEVQARDSATWTLQGCYTDTSTSRTLAGASYANASTMTVESCIAFCSAGGFSLAGVEFGDECYCDRALQSPGTLTSAKNCDVPCSGNLTEVCGAGNFLDVYWNGAPLPIIPQTVGTWKYYGCFSDSVASRALPNLTIPESVTVESCISACKAKDFAVAGLEFGLECWCSNSIPTSSLLSDSDCSTGCTANTTEVCGGPSKLTVYEDTTAQICLSTTHSPNFNLTTSNCTRPTTGTASVRLPFTIPQTVTLVALSILSIRRLEFILGTTA